MAEQTYLVRGMTCGHCVSAVREEVGKMPGVRHVEVDLESGRVRVEGAGFTGEQIREAVDEAGYALADG